MRTRYLLILVACLTACTTGHTEHVHTSAWRNISGQQSRIARKSVNVSQVIPMPENSPQRSPGNFPWMARNPKNGLWYSSRFNATELYVYAISDSSITYKGTVQLPQTISRIQGGEFSPSGRLFLATDWNTGLVVTRKSKG
ncbi:hypothetical protein ACLESO_48560 [Pyxidicoccus sp. 3LG]